MVVVVVMVMMMMMVDSLGEMGGKEETRAGGMLLK